MLSCFKIKCAKYYDPNWLNCLSVCLLWAKYYSKSQASIILKTCVINAVRKRKYSNCVVILSDQGGAATISNLTECTICARMCSIISKVLRVITQRVSDSVEYACTCIVMYLGTQPKNNSLSKLQNNYMSLNV